MGVQLCLFPREELHAYPFHSQQRNTGSHSIFELLHGLGSQRAWLIAGPFRLSVRHGLVGHIPQIPMRKHAFGNPTPAAWKQQYNSVLIHPCLTCTTILLLTVWLAPHATSRATTLGTGSTWPSLVFSMKMATRLGISSQSNSMRWARAMNFPSELCPFRYRTQRVVQ